LFGGERLAERAARALVGACPLAIEVGPGWSRLPALRESPPDQGPLCAVVAGCSALRARGHFGPVVVLAVDLPQVTTELLTFLARHPGTGSIVPLVEGRPQPLCARYSPEALSLAGELVAAGARSMLALLERVEVLWLFEDRWQSVASRSALDDVDRPEDLATARRLLSTPHLEHPTRWSSGGEMIGRP
ncbi:MAG: molybdenum cofactor guanylyltransferase, partial [Acidimicrobiia bacterium]